MNPRRNALRALAVMIAVVGAIFATITLPRPMTVPVVDESALDESAGPPEQSRPVQPPAPVLIKVAISPEARVKATATTGQRDLRQGEWSEFTIVIDNAAGITAPLVVESEQLSLSKHDTARDHWLRLELLPSGPLSGEASETRTLRLLSRDPGIRTAVLNVNAGQGTQDLGFRSDVILSFRVTRSKSALRSAVGPYTNTSSRAAAENHYRTMTLDAIRNEPMKSVAAENTHLHLWMTNAFRCEAFDVMHECGFKYKSCLIWVKPQLGMGNYWRVSHEYLLFGIRGDLPFRSNRVRSWQSSESVG